MCGFCGVLRLDGQPVDPAPLEWMNEAIVHRGPDDGYVLVDGPVALANRRLAILDLRPEARLPMSRGSLHLAYNGEVYNFAAKRAELEAKGHQFTTTGDSEVIIALYREYGQAFVDHLDGMFAVALWDADQRTLLIGRDPAGKKPLFYYHGGGHLVFGSEIKCLLRHPLVPREARLEVLPLVVTFGYAPTPHTCFRGIEQLPQGQLMVVANGQVQTNARTYGPRLECTPGDGRAEDWTDAIIDTLREGVRERLVSDVPLGAFLSGGIDSSLIVALMAELSPGRVRTFSIGFPDHPRWDESAYAQRVADRFGTEHEVLEAAPAQAEELFPRLVWHNDQPFGDDSALPTLMLSEMTRKHVTVALCGDAGDELFAGYERFKLASWVASGWPHRPLGRAALTVAEAFSHLARRIPSVAHHGMRGVKGARCLAMPLPYAYQDTMVLTRADVLQRLWGGPADSLTPSHFYDGHFPASDQRDWLSRILDFNYATYLLDDLLVKVDRMSMATSLEVRAPFLSDSMVRLASRVPTGLKLRNGVTKYVLKQAARRYLPDDIIDRRKRGFGIPLVHWFRTRQLRDYARQLLLDSRATQRGIYRPGAVESILTEHETHAWDHGRTIWILCLVELWFQMYLDQEPSPPAAR